jgi:glutaredoxin-related protein
VIANSYFFFVVFSRMEDRLNRLATAAPVFAFIVGNPLIPANEESQALVARLRKLGVLFSCFDMENTADVAKALPEKFGGGEKSSRALLCIEGKAVLNWSELDDVLLMKEIPEGSKGQTEEEALHDHCVELTNSAPVVVFIKGSLTF